MTARRLALAFLAIALGVAAVGVYRASMGLARAIEAERVERELSVMSE